MMTAFQVSPSYWESLAAVLAMFVVGSLFLQQALLMIFEQDVFRRLNEKKREGRAVVYRFVLDLKPVISLAASLLIIFQYQFDVFETVLQGPRTGFTMVMSALLFSGGSLTVSKLHKIYREVQEAESGQRIAQAKKNTPE